jgi:hypothetical protein
MPKGKRGNPNLVKGGPSLNPGGRPKWAQTFAKKGGPKYLEKLQEIALEEAIVLKDEKGEVVDVERPNRGDQIRALIELLKISGEAYLPEVTKQQVELTQIESDATKKMSTDEVVRRQLQLVQGGKKDDDKEEAG